MHRRSFLSGSEILVLFGGNFYKRITCLDSIYLAAKGHRLPWLCKTSAKSRFVPAECLDPWQDEVRSQPILDRVPDGLLNTCVCRWSKVGLGKVSLRNPKGSTYFVMTHIMHKPALVFHRTHKKIDQVLFKVSWDFFLSDSSTLGGNHSKILNTATDLACLHRLESVQEQQDRWIRCPPGTDQLMAHALSLLHPYDREDEQTEQTEQNADATWKQLFRAASGTKGKKICTAPAIGNCLSVQQN